MYNQGGWQGKHNTATYHLDRLLVLLLDRSACVYSLCADRSARSVGSTLSSAYILASRGGAEKKEERRNHRAGGDEEGRKVKEEDMDFSHHCTRAQPAPIRHPTGGLRPRLPRATPAPALL